MYQWAIKNLKHTLSYAFLSFMFYDALLRLGIPTSKIPLICMIIIIVISFFYEIFTRDNALGTAFAWVGWFLCMVSIENVWYGFLILGFILLSIFVGRRYEKYLQRNKRK